MPFCFLTLEKNNVDPKHFIDIFSVQPFFSGIILKRWNLAFQEWPAPLFWRQLDFSGWPLILLKSAPSSNLKRHINVPDLRYKCVNVKDLIFKCPIKLPTSNILSYIISFTSLFLSYPPILCIICSSLDLSCGCHCWSISSPPVPILHASLFLY